MYLLDGPFIKWFGSGSLFGGVVVYLLQKLIDRTIDREFSRDEKGYKRLFDRYEKLYSPLIHQLMEVVIESGGKLTLKNRLPMAVRGLLKGKLRYAWEVLKYAGSNSPKEYYLANYSHFDLEGIRKHVKKHHGLADRRLIELLRRAVRARKEQQYFVALTRNIDPNYNNDNSVLIPDEYCLISHIYLYSEYLNKTVNPR